MPISTRRAEEARPYLRFHVNTPLAQATGSPDGVEVETEGGPTDRTDVRGARSPLGGQCLHTYSRACRMGRRGEMHILRVTRIREREGLGRENRVIGSLE